MVAKHKTGSKCRRSHYQLCDLWHLCLTSLGLDCYICDREMIMLRHRVWGELCLVHHVTVC